MKLLSYSGFVSEKLNIQPVSKDRLNKMGNVLDKKYFWSGKRTVGEEQVVLNIMKLGFSKECWLNFSKACNDTSERFDSWEKLSMAEQLKKHKTRSKQKLTKAKVFATLLAAFVYYKSDPKYYTVIEDYIARVKEDFDLNDKQLEKIYFGKYNN